MLVIIVKNLSNEVVFDDIDLWPWVHGNPRNNLNWCKLNIKVTQG